MINNPARNIHTDYVPSDIFKPQDANALAQSVSYDYVITKERIDAYRAELGYDQSQWIDVGSLLWYDQGADPDYPAGRPSISIFFNCYTSIEDRFQFGSWLSALAEHGVTAIHIYSLSSYRSDGGSGSLALYYHTSGSENYVLFDGGNLYRSHAVYVGSFACAEGSAIWHSPAPFVYEYCLYGELPHGSSADEVVEVRQEPWMSNAANGGGGHAIAVMLSSDHCGCSSSAPWFYVGASNGHAISINPNLPNGGPISGNGTWDKPFIMANTIKVEGRALASAEHCRSAPGLNVTGLAKLDIFTAGGVVTLHKGIWYTASGGSKAYAEAEYAAGLPYPYFYINGDSLQEGQQLEISINIVQFPPHSFIVKSDPYAYVADKWVSGSTYNVGDVVSYQSGTAATKLYEALVTGPTSQPGTSQTDWEEITLISLEGPHDQAIPGKTKQWTSPSYFNLYIVDNSGDLLPLYSWGYADPSMSGPVVNAEEGSAYQPLHPSFDEAKSLLAGSAPAGFGILASSQITLCKVGGRILVLGSMYSGYYYSTV